LITLLPIQFKIQFQHVNAWLAEKAKLPPFGVRRDQSTQFFFGNPSFARHPRNLKLSRSGRDMRIETRSGAGHEINWDGLARILSLKPLPVASDAFEQLLTRWPKVRP